MKRWLGIRVEFLGSLITMFATLFSIIQRDKVNTSWAALSIILSLNVKEKKVFSIDSLRIK